MGKVMTAKKGKRQPRAPGPKRAEQKVEEKNKREVDKKLDQALEFTFPASDPLAVNSNPEPVDTGWVDASNEKS